ncbi:MULTISPECIES: HAD-IA family hydrolase [Streptomyces]|uniref:HAD-IA family hydrolase n=1 Tax=Streptomyces flaveolus TaxID=67297 RepID=A0ABV3AQ81_9ACTN|nr:MULTISPECIES: HAD-IA family hydrolase [Streptomyces]KMS67448.1 haloacid dehalogenase [Streptomyces regensis]KOG75172.1 haloacid dehalogenase [Streptomyces antibioticus]KOV71674.1 haloacid dehalogenase [Streptomyces sp. NRRL WC-3723]
MTQHRKGLVLDFGGVLTTPLLPAALAFEKRAGLAEGTLLTGLYLNPEGIRLTEELERGTLTQTQWNEAAGRLLGIAPDNLMGRIFADLRPETSVIAAAAAARRAGVKVGILSNSVGLTPWNLYDGYEVDELYDAVVLSELHGTRKPERESFRLVLERLGLSAEECVFVDDTEQYLPPAAELGFTTVHAVEPTRTVAALENLLGVALTDAHPERTAP